MELHKKIAEALANNPGFSIFANVESSPEYGNTTEEITGAFINRDRGFIMLADSLMTEKLSRDSFYEKL